MKIGLRREIKRYEALNQYREILLLEQRFDTRKEARRYVLNNRNQIDQRVDDVKKIFVALSNLKNEYDFELLKKKFTQLNVAEAL